MSRTIKTCLMAILLTFGLVAPGFAQRIVSGLSANIVSVDSTFSGETLTIFGNIEPEIDSKSGVTEDGYQIIILVRGPAIDRVARRKTGDLGIWLNTEQVVFESFPSYFWVISSSALENIASEEVLLQLGLLPNSQPHMAAARGNGDPELFGQELVRLMQEDKLFGVEENGVNFRSRTLYSASLSLPANVPNGNFLAQTFLLKDGEVIAEKAQGFSVRKTGFERLMGTSAQSMPLIYGLVCVVLAIFTGWLGGVVFRR